MDIKSVIQKKGLLMTKAAEMMGITPQALSQIVNGNPTVRKIEMMAKAIGCSPADFFGDWVNSQTDSEISSAEDKHQEHDNRSELPFDGTKESESIISQGTQAIVCPKCGCPIGISVAAYEKQ